VAAGQGDIPLINLPLHCHCVRPAPSTNAALIRPAVADTVGERQCTGRAAWRIIASRYPPINLFERLSPTCRLGRA
jgi:hypothetical protein